MRRLACLLNFEQDMPNDQNQHGNGAARSYRDSGFNFPSPMVLGSSAGSGFDAASPAEKVKHTLHHRSWGLPISLRMFLLRNPTVPEIAPCSDLLIEGLFAYDG